MVMDERKRQKKLAKQKSKQRREKQAAAVEKQFLTSMVGKMTLASDGRIVHCLLSNSAHEELNGMVTVTLVRTAPRGQVAFATYLVDLWCLGVKDCTGKLLDTVTCHEIIDDMRERLQTISITPAQAHAIVIEGVRYAHSLGLAPHADYEKLAPIWSGIPVGEMPRGLEFGKDGRPCYIVGPYDDQAKQNMVFRALFESVGEGNFDFVSGISQQINKLMFERIDEFTVPRVQALPIFID